MNSRVPLPNPTTPRDWADQISLEKIGPNKFRSLKGAPFGGFVGRNGESRPRAFGGHVYAQATYAASKTVSSGYFIHSVTGYFIALGYADESFIYNVTVIRDGRSYCVRRVDVSQEDGQICFSSICSFKTLDQKFLDSQIPRNFEEEYREVLKGVSPQNLPLNTVTNVRNFRDAYDRKENFLTRTFPGMITSVLDMDPLHQNQHPLSRRNLYAYSALDSTNSSSADPNLEACAHMYHSDRESVWGMVRNFELLDILSFAASLSHTIIFHAGPDKLSFRGGQRWFYLETIAERLADGRGLHKGKIYDADGYHVASTMQDGAIRLRDLSSNEMAERQNKAQYNGKL